MALSYKPLLTAGGMLVAVTWRLSQTEIALREAISTSQKDVEDRQERMSREFGETVTAIRQKVHEVETWARDEFVRKGSFDNGMGRVERMLGDQFDRIEAASIGWKRRSTTRCTDPPCPHLRLCSGRDTPEMALLF